MNLRTLKKLSNRAAALLPVLGDTRQQFRAERHDNYGSTFIGDRKHWERSRCHQSYKGHNDWIGAKGTEIVFTTRAGNRVVMRPPVHPRKGTVMVGATSGYYEPEWDEETAWDALDTIVRHHFMDWSEDGPNPLRDFPSPKEILAGAREILAILPSSHGARAMTSQPDTGGGV